MTDFCRPLTLPDRESERPTRPLLVRLLSARTGHAVQGCLSPREHTGDRDAKGEGGGDDRERDQNQQECVLRSNRSVLSRQLAAQVRPERLRPNVECEEHSFTSFRRTRRPNVSAPSISAALSVR